MKSLQLCKLFDHILTYAGLTQDPNLENYSIILDYIQYNLQEYLKTKEFSWAEKLKLAKELTSGVTKQVI